MTTVKRIKKLEENVINKIAAGEIIQRPANAIKELLENSLDAGSTQIIISIKQGGLGVIQIQDNGSGICKDDFPLLCEKFTTSKLQEFHDLLTIDTFGFRGEALASITHVAHVQITSKTSDSPCAFKAEFCDSRMVSNPKPCAGNTGTIVRVEDLFYNITIRKQALSSPREEYTKIVDVVSSYAILNAHKCSITLKRIDDKTNPSPDVRIVAETSMDDCIVDLFGSELSKQLLSIDHLDDKLCYSLSGRISKPSYHSRKLKFILFINKRLVHCNLLKKAIESVFVNLLPKHTFPFVFISLELPSKNLDVNVHPTKYEVHFLHQELIVASIQEFIEKSVSSSSESRSFSTKSLLDKSFSSRHNDSLNSSMSSACRSQPRPSEKIRVDPKLQKIKAFFPTKDLNESTSSSPAIKNNENSSELVLSKNIPQSNNDLERITFPKIIKSETPDKSDQPPSAKIFIKDSPSISISDIPCMVAERQYRKIELSTLEKLRQTINTTNLCNWKSFVYVGMIDHNRVLIQREKELLLLNTPIVNYNLFYQLCLYYFGNFGTIDLIDDEMKENQNNRTLLKDLLIFGLREAGELYEGLEPDLMINVLRDNCEMLLDYFSIRINIDSMTLETIPMVLDKFIPDLRRLPRFILNLCTKINWQEEESCLHGICREIAEFYAYGIGSNTSLFAVKDEFENVFENVILPMYRSFLRIPSSFEHDGTLIKLTSLPDLYSVFERC